MSTIADSPTGSGFRVLLAEPLPLLGALLADVVSAQPNMSVVGAVSPAPDLLVQTRRSSPHLVVLDWALGGLAALCALRALTTPPLVIVIAVAMEHDFAALVRRHGGLGCLDREQILRLLPPLLEQARSAYHERSGGVQD
jgi:DNA-binding NarL/FixJ family response regulator